MKIEKDVSNLKMNKKIHTSIQTLNHMEPIESSLALTSPI